MTEPVHPQLLDPILDPEEFIAASIYWYPLLFPTRTEVLEHTMLCNGNGYEWGEDGNIRSVFSHIEPDRDRLDNYLAEARKYEDEAKGEKDEGMRDLILEWAERERVKYRELVAIRDDYQNLAHVIGPVRMTENLGNGPQARMITSRDLPWTLLGRAPENVPPAWQAIIDETRELFAPIMVEQGELWTEGAL